MSQPGRPKIDYRGVQHEGRSVSPFEPGACQPAAGVLE